MKALNQLELIGETLRHALNVLATVAPEWLKPQVANAFNQCVRGADLFVRRQQLRSKGLFRVGELRFRTKQHPDRLLWREAARRCGQCARHRIDAPEPSCTPQRVPAARGRDGKLPRNPSSHRSTLPGERIHRVFDPTARLRHSRLCRGATELRPDLAQIRENLHVGMRHTGLVVRDAVVLAIAANDALRPRQVGSRHRRK